MPSRLVIYSLRLFLTFRLTRLAAISLVGYACSSKPPAEQPSPPLVGANATREQLTREVDAIEHPVKPSPLQQATAPAGVLPPAEPVRGTPPAGARPHPPLPAVGVTLHSSPRSGVKRGEKKGVPSQGTPPAPPPTGLTLGFAGNVQPVRPGLNPDFLVPKAPAVKRGYTYAFLLLNELPSPSNDERLAAAGVVVLGRHGAATKARVPVDPARLEAIAKLPFVDAITYAHPKQKVERSVQAALDAELPGLPVTINAFDAAALREVEQWLIESKASVGKRNEELISVSAVVTPAQIDALARQDTVLWVELAVSDGPGHDQSMSVLAVDYVRSGGAGDRYSGASTVLGILDTGFMLGSGPAAHGDLRKYGCGIDFTADAGDTWNDLNGHGTHVLATAIGTGAVNPVFRGVAPDVGSSDSAPVRASKIWNALGQATNAGTIDGYRFMRATDRCKGALPHVVNLSGGTKGAWAGTDEHSREADLNVWLAQQTWVVCAGNSGPTDGSIWTPGAAKNVLTVGNVRDYGTGTVGEVTRSSSRGPTLDGRLKPNVVAPGDSVCSARAGTANGYEERSGCSMATPHVSGLVSALLEHYPAWREVPQLVRAHLMATALLRDGLELPPDNSAEESAERRSTFGLGQVSPYPAHWDRENASGWVTLPAWATVTSEQSASFDVDVPQGAQRLIVVMSWDEPPASAGADVAVMYDIDLWITHAPCVPEPGTWCGDWASQSSVDNVEYVIVDRPPPGKHTITMANVDAPPEGVVVAATAVTVLGATAPKMNFTATAAPITGAPGSFAITTSVRSDSWVLADVHVGLDMPALPVGVQLRSLSTHREDGLSTEFREQRGLTLGTIVEGSSRSAVWTFDVSAGAAPATTLAFRATSENGLSRAETVSVTLPPASSPVLLGTTQAPQAALSHQCAPAPEKKTLDVDL